MESELDPETLKTSTTTPLRCPSNGCSNAGVLLDISQEELSESLLRATRQRSQKERKKKLSTRRNSQPEETLNPKKLSTSSAENGQNFWQKRHH